MQSYDYQTLTAIEGETVKLRDAESNEVELTLKEVKKGPMDSEQWEAFSAYYEGCETFSVPGGTYALSHPAFGCVELLVSPKSHTEYETVVIRNRYTPVA